MSDTCWTEWFRIVIFKVVKRSHVGEFNNEDFHLKLAMRLSVRRDVIGVGVMFFKITELFSKFQSCIKHYNESILRLNVILLVCLWFLSRLDVFSLCCSLFFCLYNFSFHLYLWIFVILFLSFFLFLELIKLR